MSAKREILSIHGTGKELVLGFRGRDFFDDVNLAELRGEVLALIAEHSPRKISFDLTGVRLLPSGLLGLLASVRNKGVEVHLHNPCEDIRETLSITNLDRLMTVHDEPIVAP